MPAVRMKDRENISCLRVCQQSNVISKKPHYYVENRLPETEIDLSPQELRNQIVLPVSNQVTADVEAIDSNLGPKETFQFQNQPSNLVDSARIEKTDSADTCSSQLEMIISPILEPTGVLNASNFEIDAGSNTDCVVTRFGAADTNESRNYGDYQTCSISDFCISEMIIANLPFEENNLGVYSLPPDKLADPIMFIDAAEQCTIMPNLEDFAWNNFATNPNLYQQSLIHPDNVGLYLAMDEIKFSNGEVVTSDLDQSESYDPHLFIKNLPELSEVVSESQSTESPKEMHEWKTITLALDLDETLVHSTVVDCDDADFVFTICLNMKEHTVYVKQRPHLRKFLERVAEMFEVVIFTASQSVYADQVLNVLDPDGKLISRRFYRESCILLDGIYTKDLTVLGIDLAKVAIVDNYPQVFRLQVDNGIPIKSWFNDPSDSALISLFPFLETLADAEDVRPLIAKKFGNKE